MEITILHTDDCPNWRLVPGLLAQAAANAGVPEPEITIRLIASPADARATPFSGSPTILVNGVDPFPSSGPVGELACRIYQTPNGLAGAPMVEQLAAVLAHDV
ncbi:thioredoxin family protein [Humibacter antri]